MAEVPTENGDAVNVSVCEASDPDSNEVQHNRVAQVVSLKEICIDCVTKNFEMYNTAFLTTKDATLSRSLQFLQRRYSSRIILDLASEELLDDRHLDLLINEHLKELDVRVLLNSGCTFQVIRSRIAAVGHSFAKVSFDVPSNVWDENVPDFVNQVICHLPNVEVLHIRQHCNDMTLKNIAIYCNKLNELNIDYSGDVTNQGLEMLCTERESQTECCLKILSFKDTSVTETGVVFLLKNMPSLEVVHHSDLPYVLYSMHKDNFKNNTLSSVKKYNLTKLDLLNRMSNVNSDCIGKASILHVWTEVCPNISTLCIEVEKGECFHLISRFSKLEHLTIECASSSDRPYLDLNGLLKSNGAKLQTLQIEGFNLSAAELISSCPKLENLVLANVRFESFGDTKKKSLNHLNELFLEDLAFSDQYAEDSLNSVLLSSPKLEKLAFEHCKFENSEMNTKLAKFCENNDIQSLRFYYCDIDVPLLESIILTCPTLKTLLIDSCENVTPDDVNNIQLLKTTTRSFVEITCIDYESELHSIYSNEDDFFPEQDDLDYEHDYDGYDVDDYDLDEDDPYLFYDYNEW